MKKKILPMVRFLKSFMLQMDLQRYLSATFVLFFASSVFFSVAALQALSGNSARVIKFDPKIKTVTVYPDRALVVREQLLRLPAGKIKLRFENASPSLIPHSMQAFCGQSGCFVQGVHSYIEKNLTYKNPQVDRLAKKMDELDAQLEKQKNIVVRVQKEIAELKRYKKYLALAIAHSSVESKTVTARQWQLAMDFLRSRLMSANAEKKKAEETIARIKEQIGLIGKQVRQLRASGAKDTRIVEISLDILKPMNSRVSFSYLIGNAAWHVSYGMYLKKNHQIHIEYYGNVKQQTGEDWSNVDLRLSTAKPASGTKRPGISSLLVYGKKQTQKTVYRQTEEKVFQQSSSRPEIPQKSDKANAFTRVEKAGLSLVFRINKKSTILSRDQKQRVTITQFTTPQAQMNYRLVPSVSRLAHLVARVKHNSEYPILQGRADIYRYSGFVGQSNVMYTPQNSQLIVGFGADRSIKVRRNVSRKTESIGVITSEKRFTTHIETAVEFHGKGQYPLYVWERIPVSQVEEVKVKLGEKTSSGYDSVNERDGIFKWKLQMSPGQSRNIQLHYQVTVPKNFRGSILGQ